jgi:hypothetical protein
MLRDSSSRSDGDVAGFDAEATQRPSWQTIHRALQKLARRRAALDAEEARWLREAERCEIWRELGMVSALDYLERVFGYSPPTAQERLRVARALGGLPVLTEALEQGQLPYSAIRRLTRVVTLGTERAWCDAAIGKNMREIEDLVRGHSPGDRPEDPVDPEVCTQVVKLELAGEAFALWRQAHQVLDEERGHRLSDDEFVAALCGAVLARGDASEPTGRAKFQIAMTVCKRCRQGWQEGAGVRVAVDASTVARAYCDAQEIGSIDGAEPERAHQDVSPSVMRLVWRRDSGHCRVPGCRSARSCEVHHLVHREYGGSHEASNLILLCSACHAAHHRGKLKISGTADQLAVQRTAEQRCERDRPRDSEDDMGAGCALNSREVHVDTNKARDSHALHVDTNRARDARGSRWSAVQTRAQAKEALVGMGWKPKIAAAAVQAAASALSEDVAIEKLLFEALRRCPRPVS